VEAVRISIEAMTNSDRYNVSDRAWEMSILPAKNQGFLIRFDPSTVSQVDAGWMLKGARLEGVVRDSAVAVFALSNRYTDAARKAPAVTLTGPVGISAQLSNDAERLNLAFATQLGEVLAIGEDIVSWEWDGGSSILYLLVFPSPWGDGVSGGKFTVDLAPGLLRPRADMK
jgi:hypothetical protein